MTRIAPTNQGCPVPWCESIHDDGDFTTHHGLPEEFPILLDQMFTGLEFRGHLAVGLDQPNPDGVVKVSLAGPFGEMWLSLRDAKRLAMRLIQLDIDIAGEGGR